MRPSRPTPLARIGRHFRAAFVPDSPAALAARAYICPLCHTPADAGARQWSPYRRRYVCTECIPAIVRARGQAATLEWLETGSYRPPSVA